LTGGRWESEEFIAAIADRLERCASAGNACAAELAPVESVPTAAVRAEPEAPTPPRKGHFSASALNTYAECARKWFYRYLCGAVEDRGSSASFYGTAFHLALERFHRELPRPHESTRAEVELKLRAYVVEAFDRYRGGFASNVEFELQRRRALRTADRYLDWLTARAAQAPFTVVGVEVATQLELAGHRFVGYIDRLDRDDAGDAVAVVDYKTGSIAEGAAAYRHRVARFCEFQLPFYYWARTAAGDRVTRLVLLPLKDASADVVPIELEVVAMEPSPSPSPVGRRGDDAPTGTISIAELERARARMIEICDTLAAGGTTHFTVTDDPDACTYCAYRSPCRERPAVFEDRFGR
jgi:RecB family exonuclease